MQRAFNGAGAGSALKIVSDGRAAIDYLSEAANNGDHSSPGPPHLVLLDLKLPQVSGFEVLEWIRRHPTHAALPVVIFSSSAYGEDRRKALALGATDYWPKPGSGLQYTNIVAAIRDQWPSAFAAALRKEPLPT